jgi:tight adherence protein B
MFSAIGAGFIGLRVGGWILAAFFAPLAFVLARRVIKSRATASRQQLTMQLPYALDSLASGISAGLTFQQAVSFASQELPEPSAGAMRRIHLRMALGHPVETSISALSDFYSDEAFALAIDGIILQRQFGGNLIAHLEESATLLRDRMELQQEVQSITAQGRLSGWVIGALVPVSAGILLAFNPQYINVLFDTLIGQLVLITVILLQVIGWTIISRLVCVRY